MEKGDKKRFTFSTRYDKIKHILKVGEKFMRFKRLLIFFLFVTALCLMAGCAEEKEYKNRYFVIFWCEGKELSRCTVVEGEAPKDSDIPALPEEIAGYYWEMEPIPDAIYKNTTIQIEKRAKTYTVSFDNGDTAEFVFGRVMENMTYPERDGYEFGGYLYNDKLYTRESIYDIPDDVSMTAEWKLLFAYNKVDNGICITGYNGGNTDKIVVPSRIDGDEVVAIEKGILAGFVTESLTLPFLGYSVETDDNSTLAYTFGYEQNIPAKLREVEIVNAEKIAEKAFYGCGRITDIKLPDTVTEIGAYAFADCRRLRAFDLSGVKTIMEHAFENCSDSNFREIDLHAAVEVFDYAFYGCSHLTTVNLNQIKQIGAYAFYGCSLLRTVNINAGDPPILGEFAFYTDGTGEEPIIILNMKIRVPTLSRYLSADVWEDYVGYIVMMSSSVDAGEIK